MSPASALQRGLVACLKADAAFLDAAGGRVFDRVPASAPFPYVQIGELQRLDDGGDCYAGCEIFVTLHVWTETVGVIAARDLGGIVTSALDGADLDLSAWGHRLVEIIFREERAFDDPNGVNAHGVLTFRAHVEPV